MSKIDIFNTDKKYNIIYADPPWKYNDQTTKASRTVNLHYSTMKTQDMFDFPINKIAAENAVLFMWVTYPKLKEGIELLEKWGFTYKTCAFTWVKTNKNNNDYFMGMGYYTRSNAEIVLLGVKGKPLERKSHSVRQIISAKIMEHSRKPHETRERIVELFGDLPRIELFARQHADGWDCWGDEVPEMEGENNDR